MKKNRMMRLASILLVCVLLTTSVISGTFAKYTSSATATDTATVAKWSFKVGDADIAKAKTFTVDLFTTAYDLTDGKVGNAEDAHVKEDGKIIAPGTGGYFKLNLKNESEVTAKYTITLFDITDAGVPLEFSVDGENWYKPADAAHVKVEGTLAIGAAAADSAPIYWRWAFYTSEAGNVADTNLGTATTLAKPSVTVKIVAEQVD